MVKIRIFSPNVHAYVFGDIQRYFSNKKIITHNRYVPEPKSKKVQYINHFELDNTFEDQSII